MSSIDPCNQSVPFCLVRRDREAAKVVFYSDAWPRVNLPVQTSALSFCLSPGPQTSSRLAAWAIATGGRLVVTSPARFLQYLLAQNRVGDSVCKKKEKKEVKAVNWCHTRCIKCACVVEDVLQSLPGLCSLCMRAEEPPSRFTPPSVCRLNKVMTFSHSNVIFFLTS